MTPSDAQPRRAYCSEHSPTEPMAGTADHVGAWILLEYKPVWKARALAESSLDDATRSWLDDNLVRLQGAGVKPRPQLVRQPEIDGDEVRLLVAFPGRVLTFAGRGYAWLQDLDLLDVLARPAAYTSAQGPLYFVCTNGQRDRCCARYGLPTYAALREKVGERVWQATHLGGHRFAPNVLTLPQGVLYGRVHPENVPQFVEQVESGGLFFSRLRGRSWYPQQVQAAEALLQRSDLRLLHVSGDARAARVSFTCADGTLQVTVRQQQAPIEVLASCGDASLMQVFPYRLD